MGIITKADVDLWVESNLNVLFSGKHGVGKTAIITEVFNRHNLRWKYFSAATMDPWVDFIGVPREDVDANGNKVLELIRPAGFNDDTIDAIFVDELNRAPKKVRNALMELIQFKTINGVRFDNLKLIWAAINPDDEEDTDVKYDVDVLDFAQKDRFHIFIDVPYRPDHAFFKNKYGASGEGALEWWFKLTEEERNLVSPRRLDYALDHYKNGGNLRHMLHHTLNVASLIERINSGSIKKALAELVKAPEDEIEKAFGNGNFADSAFDLIMKSEQYIKRFVKYLSADKISLIVSKMDKLSSRVVNNSPDDVIDPILQDLCDSSTKARKKKYANKFGRKAHIFMPPVAPKPTAATIGYDTDLLLKSASRKICNTVDREGILEGLLVNISLANSADVNEFVKMYGVVAIVAARSNVLHHAYHQITKRLTKAVADLGKIAGVDAETLYTKAVDDLLPRSRINANMVITGVGYKLSDKQIAKIEQYLGLRYVPTTWQQVLPSISLNTGANNQQTVSAMKKAIYGNS